MESAPGLNIPGLRVCSVKSPCAHVYHNSENVTGHYNLPLLMCKLLFRDSTTVFALFQPMSSSKVTSWYFSVHVCTCHKFQSPKKKINHFFKDLHKKTA